MALKEGKHYLMKEEKKTNADYNGEDIHMMRNGYQYSDRYLVVKASHYMQKRKL